MGAMGGQSVAHAHAEPLPSEQAVVPAGHVRTGSGQASM